MDLILLLDASGSVSDEELESYLSVASDQRIYALPLALERGTTVDRIQALTAIDPWFLYKIKRISEMSKILGEYSPATLPSTTMLQAKKSGFSDAQIAARTGEIGRAHV